MIDLLMVLIRKQAILFLPVILYCLIYSILQNDTARKKLKLLALIAVLISIMTGAFIFILAYPKISNIAIDQVLYSYAGKTLYMSDRADIDTYQDVDEREVFELLYDYADDGKMLYEYAKESDDMAWQHAMTGFNYTTRTVWKNVITYCRDKGLSDHAEPMLLKNIVLHQIRLHPDRFLKALYIPFGQSLISSIFIKPPAIYRLCAVITAILYMISVLLFFVCRSANGFSKKARYTYVVTMSMLLINVIALNILFQSLQRYVVYTWGMFYISLFLMLFSIVRAKAVSDGS